MMKSFVRLTSVDPGFNAEHLLVFNAGLATSAEATRQTNFYREVSEKIKAVPGVQSVGAVSQLPLAGGNSSRSFNVLGDERSYEADIRASTPDYFPTMGIPLLQGRNFSEHDTADSLPVAIINQAAAAQVFPGKNPIGQYLTNFGPKEEKLQIIGVIGNVRHVALEEAARPEIYVPITQTQWPSMFFAVRSAVSNPLSLLPAVQRAVWSVDRNVPLAHPRTMQDVLAHSVLRRKFAMLLALDFRRPRHAARRDRALRRDFLFRRPTNEGNRNPHGARRTARGHAANGLAPKREAGFDRNAGRRAGRARCDAFVRRNALRVGATDLATYLFVIVLLGAAAFLASVIPAFRATKVDPMVALRYE